MLLINNMAATQFFNERDTYRYAKQHRTRTNVCHGISNVLDVVFSPHIAKQIAAYYYIQDCSHVQADAYANGRRQICYDFYQIQWVIRNKRLGYVPPRFKLLIAIDLDKLTDSIYGSDDQPLPTHFNKLCSDMIYGNDCYAAPGKYLNQFGMYQREVAMIFRSYITAGLPTILFNTLSVNCITLAEGPSPRYIFVPDDVDCGAHTMNDVIPELMDRTCWFNLNIICKYHN
jgi:hypothetical protein